MDSTTARPPTATAVVVRPFEEEAGSVLDGLRAALAALVEGISPPVRRAAELQKALRLDKNLSWSVFTAATTSDPQVVASLVPGERAMARVFEAARGLGVASETLDRARAAFKHFEQTVRRHADDREAFEAMVSDLSDRSAGATLDARHRRSVFRGNALLWGRQVRSVVGPMLVHPSQTPGLVDRVMISGMLGLRQTRRGVPLHTTVHHRRVTNPGDPAGPVPVEPLEPGIGAAGDVGLLPEFCSRPLPQFRTITNRGDHVRHELMSRGMGAAAEVTFFTGRVLRACATIPGSVPGSEITTSKLFDVPTELFIRDVLLHESIWDEQLPDVSLYAHPADGSLDFQESDRLPCLHSAALLGRGVEAARTPEIPRYAELLQYAMDKMQWNAEEFRVFRCRIECPLMYARLKLTFRRT